MRRFVTALFVAFCCVAALIGFSQADAAPAVGNGGSVLPVAAVGNRGSATTGQAVGNGSSGVQLPIMIPVAGVFGSGGGNVPDPGPSPAAYLLQTVDWNQEPVGTGTQCGTAVGPSNCQPHKYIDFMRNSCLTTQTVQVMNWALPAPTPSQSANETAFQHLSPTNPTPSPVSSPYRLVATATGANCSAYNGNGNGTHPFIFNPHDSSFQTFLTNNVWNQTSSDYYPAPYGAYEDTSGVLGDQICGDGSSGAPFSTEFSLGWNIGNVSRCDVVNSSATYNVGVSYDTALGSWLNAACPGSPCLSMTINGGAPSANANVTCGIVSSGHCYDKNFPGDVDDSYENAYKAVIAANTAGNLKYIDEESPIFSHTSAYQYASSSNFIHLLNTWVNFQNDTTTANVKLTDLEPGFGGTGPGDNTDGVGVRTAVTAAHFLVPDPATGIPDRIVFRYLPSGTTGDYANESEFYFEETLVPYGPEHATSSSFVFNGTTADLGGGCDNQPGDTGGIQQLLVQCVGTAGIYCQQYKGVFQNGNPYGAMAVCLNTSTTSEPILGSWFTGDPITSYNYSLALSAKELASVQYANIPSGVVTIPTCVSSTYCDTGNTANTMAENLAPFNNQSPPSLCGHCGIVLVATN